MITFTYRFFCSVMMIIMFLCEIIGSLFYEMNSDEELIETSKSVLEAWELCDGRTFSVFLDENNVYHADINGTELLYKIDEGFDRSYTPSLKTNVSDCAQSSLGIIESSGSINIDSIEEYNQTKQRYDF